MHFVYSIKQKVFNFISGVWRKSVNADYIAVDGLSFSDKNIPLFLFGMLY